MKYQEKMATSKVDRTLKFIGTGAKIGGNYLKHYAKKAINPGLEKEELHKENAEDIYQTLSQLKGSALKVAQMLSMDKAVLPKAYSDKFSMAQYQAPPLSAPLVVQTFVKSLGAKPTDLFDSFSSQALHAASMGQVHEAFLNEKRLAVKIQYPGVAESIQSDLKLVKPIALRMLNLSEKELQKYLEEVESKLLEETDYQLELKRSQEIAASCSHLQDVVFANYYPEFSGRRVLTMDWLSGKHLNEFLQDQPSQEIRNKAGQALWEFYIHQIHQLRSVHADPHPGNFLFQQDGKVGVIDFGCVKEIPDDFYFDYFALILPGIQHQETLLEQIMERIEMLQERDNK
ncbi:MAG: AarF/ABC1/UbiB kinase family protein, partial [Bacteroidota bacterium]|nr:AarF/ABC1/UbiB kinase family protein [Bacteroidota bacterium]MDX5430308.1 AarF/ABC1/UbiB kinase family protein [Bacteroidota bacterium]MDX5469069.1 AarF/ABC1/UbiB kinase family protein [Bacteroidota bacterium]